MTGMYYKSFGDTIRRIDNSFNHKMTNFSDVFVKNDTIFKYGGYGYWSNRNSITYFDNETKEWEYYKINPPQIPPSLAFFSSSMIGDYYYVYSGYDVDPFSGATNLKNNNVWLFNFNLWLVEVGHRLAPHVFLIFPALLGFATDFFHN